MSTQYAPSYDCLTYFFSGFIVGYIIKLVVEVLEAVKEYLFKKLGKNKYEQKT